MGVPVMILGASGTGKSASMRNLAPDCYGLVNVARKPLPFRSNKKALNSDDYPTIRATMGRATSNIIVIDDAQYLMANEYMRRSAEKGFEKFTDIGKNFWELVRYVTDLPAEKVVYFMGHVEVDAFGNTKFKTIGKLLDEKITVEGMFTIVLRTLVQDGHYYFSTQNNGVDTVKTPIGLFAEPYIDNDLAQVDAAIRDYFGLTIAPEVKHAKSLV